MAGDDGQGLSAFLGLMAGPQGWQRRERFVVFTPDFQSGESFLATWAAWRADPGQCTCLHFIAVVAPARFHQGLDPASRTPSPEAQWLRDAWPPLTPNLHTLSFEDGKVQLLLAPGTLRDCLAELSFVADAHWLPTHADDAAWQPEACKAYARLSAPGALLCAGLPSNDAAPPPTAQAALRALGFQTEPGIDGQAWQARYAPSFSPRRAPTRMHASASTDRRAVIVGAGLAGAATAWALAGHGWRSTVLDRQPSPAMETSGNPGGLFHGIVNAQDGRHARFNRAAALEAGRVVRRALERPGTQGSVRGLLRLETRLPDVAAMRALLQRLGLPPPYVQALSPQEAGERCGLPLTRPAWFYPEGGWVRPADLVNHYLAHESGLASFHGGVAVDRLQRGDGRWQLLDAAGQVIDESEVVVLANANDSLRLLGVPDWPVQAVRGQVSLFATDALRRPLPSVPIAGSGYLLPPVDGQVLFGATAQSGDDDPRVREDDHAHNLLQLARLTGWDASTLPLPTRGRTAWRCVAEDRLPLVGAVPDLAAEPSPAWDQPRKVPRSAGLYLCTALGSRGITWSALCARVLASAIVGAPAPMEASLLDAVDPARFVSRGVRRTAARG